MITEEQMSSFVGNEFDTKILDLDESIPEPAIPSGDIRWLADTCFDSCQLIPTFMCNISAICASGCSWAPKLARKCETKL